MRRKSGSRPGGEFTTNLHFTASDEVERTIEVDVSVSPYDPGCYSGPWENSYPAEGGEVEATAFRLLTIDGSAVERTLTHDEAAALLEAKDLHALLQEAGADFTADADADGPDERDDDREIDDHQVDSDFYDACDRYTR